MTYLIEYDYQTGNSFGSYQRTDVLELDWEDKAVAMANLIRIKEHWEYFQAIDKGWGYDIKKALEAKEKFKDRDWLVVESGPYADLAHYSLILKTDDGKDWKIHAPWCGYFEKLISVRIILNQSFEGLEFNF